MNWCSVYLTPQGLPKRIYLSPPLIFPTTYNGIGTKNRPVWITPGAAPIRWMGLIRNPRWEQKRTEGYVIVSSQLPASIDYKCYIDKSTDVSFGLLCQCDIVQTYYYAVKMFFLNFYHKSTSQMNLCDCMKRMKISKGVTRSRKS